MLNQDIHPKTIGGIKRHAKQLKIAKNIPHHEALDIAARSAEFENFTHALHQLQSQNTQKLGHKLFFAAYWYDPQRKDYKAGREVLEIELSKPLSEIAIKNELANSNGLRWFRLAAPDLLVDDHISRSQENAKDKICLAVRTLRLIEATGLKPSGDFEAAYPDRDDKNQLPNYDHSTHWYDPEAGQFILIDEPYPEALVEGKRASWAKKHNWHLQASSWAGMYSPGNSRLFVATDASTGYDFEALMLKINSIADPRTDEKKNCESTLGHETFFSPLTNTPQEKKRAISRGTIYREPSNKTVPVRSWNAPYNERRPNAAMSIESHQLAARLIKAVQDSNAKPWTVNDRLLLIKSKLEDWFFLEHEKSETDKYELFYYGSVDRNDPLVLQATSSKGAIALLQDLKNLLLKEYVNCEPLRKMIRKIDTAIKSTSKNP